jgi:hypothetical protein
VVTRSAPASDQTVNRKLAEELGTREEQVTAAVDLPPIQATSEVINALARRPSLSLQARSLSQAPAGERIGRREDS